jgi:hypothetical protein
LNCAVLLLGGERNWPTPPLLLVVVHLPFAVVEGVILGFVVGFLAKVKPEMLRLPLTRNSPPVDAIAAGAPPHNPKDAISRTPSA